MYKYLLVERQKDRTVIFKSKWETIITEKNRAETKQTS